MIQAPTDINEFQTTLRTAAVRVLTMAAHASMHHGIDFADFITQVLTTTAANIGGPDKLLAQRPGSWEAGLLEELLRGTVGDEPDNWWTYRTDPLFIHLHVAQLIEASGLHPGLLGLDEAIDAVGNRYSAAAYDDESALQVWDAEVDALISRYKAEYNAYADRFSRAAIAIGHAMNLPVGVVVVANANPTSTWWNELDATNPTEDDSEPLAVAIWTAAHDAVALPNVDVRLLSSEGPG